MDAIIKPTWFLDIDGVINAVARLNNSHHRRYSEWKEVEVNGYPILYATEVIDFINRMSDATNVRMLTTWKEKSATMFNPAVGLKVFPFDDSVGTWNPSGAWNGTNHLDVGRWWKQNVIMNHIKNNGSPFVWSDDDIIPGVRKYIRAMARDAGVENYIITPFQTIGLEPAHLERIEAFVARVSG